MGVLGEEVNEKKRAIDVATKRIDEYMGNAPSQPLQDGDIVDDHEWKLRQGIRVAKKEYRDKFDSRLEAKKEASEVEARMRAVKVDLVMNFDNWFREQSGDVPNDSFAELQDVGEQFADLELARLEKIHPDGATPFFKARKHLRMQRPTGRSMRR